jgi:hypothetical protein
VPGRGDHLGESAVGRRHLFSAEFASASEGGGRVVFVHSKRLVDVLLAELVRIAAHLETPFARRVVR